MYSRIMLNVCVLCFLAGAGMAAADELIGVPLKPDPPIAVDGELGDWDTVPGAIKLDTPDHVIWGEGTWKDEQDLSATIRTAWRNEYLFIAVEVTDDVLMQAQQGSNIWKGDHIEVFLDVTPELEPDRDTFGEGQFQIGFSPGNFKHTGDPLVDATPESYCFRPPLGPVPGALTGATKTATGYILEIAIPWSFLGITAPAKDLVFGIEIGVSDTDGVEPQQESMMATSTADWSPYSRARLTPAALAGTDGKAAPPARAIAFFDSLTLDQGASSTVAVQLPTVPEGRDALLELKARMEHKTVAGHTPALRLTFNDATLTADNLVNKPMRAKSRGGQIYTLAGGDRFSTYYSPDFTSPDGHATYGLLDGYEACTFVLDVSDLVQEGGNVLVIENAAADTVDNPMIVADGQIAFRLPPPPPREKAGPPTGALAVIEPRQDPATDFTFADAGDGAIAVTVDGTTYTVRSRFSTPAGEWVYGGNAYFAHERRIEKHDASVVIHDTFTNTTDENLGIMHRYEAELPREKTGLWLAGLEQAGDTGATNVPANCTSYAATGDTGIGLIALSDAFRVHVTNYAQSGIIGLADNYLVLPPGATYTAEWAIVPTDVGDYWRFINVARELVGANFPIEGGFAFLRTDPLTEVWTDEEIASFIRWKDALWTCASITYPRYMGHYPHGTAFQRITHDNFREGFARWKRLVPETKSLVYFHCFLDVTEDGPERFADARTLRPDGVQADYGSQEMKLFIPMKTNSYGPAVAKNVDVIFDECQADGVYWDEHEYSRLMYHYSEPWDGLTGDIDAETMQVSRLKSSVTLLSEPWRVDLAKSIQARGPLVGNGAPFTKAMAELRFPCFIETGSITNCTRGHLYSPIALGDHLSERSELDAYRTMLAALDYGSVYHWYNDMDVRATHPHLTRYMFPITPVELHQGYIIGEERIVTKVSGLYGWGDSATHEVHVFDDTGREVENFNAPTITRDGKSYTELRIAEDWSAAIVRK